MHKLYYFDISKCKKKSNDEESKYNKCNLYLRQMGVMKEKSLGLLRYSANTKGASKNDTYIYTIHTTRFIHN